jgi:hypothetical protein
MHYDVQVPDLQAFTRDLEAAGANVDPLLGAAVTNSVNRVQSEARSRAAHRTGTLQRSIQTEVQGTKGEVMVEEKYGIWIEEGTGIYGPEGRPIEIVPTSKKALAFMIGGAPVIVKRVMSPGMKARPFFGPGIDASLAYIDDQFDRVTDILIRTIAGL